MHRSCAVFTTLARVHGILQEVLEIQTGTTSAPMTYPVGYPCCLHRRNPVYRSDVALMRIRCMCLATPETTGRHLMDVHVAITDRARLEQSGPPVRQTSAAR
eukprot:m.595372 g.595372  ORF g.595372 m.595372 type:complete len:102 (+) comp22402_c0_seq2:223-528(+)